MTAPLDPSASTAASLVAGTALGGQDRLAAWPGLAHLVALLHQTAAGDPALHAALAAVTAAPEDPDRVAALAHAVHALTSRDNGLRTELARLLDQAQQHPTAGGLVTQIAGHARVGKLVTIGHAGQIHVHLPPPPAPTVLDHLPPSRWDRWWPTYPCAIPTSPAAPTCSTSSTSACTPASRPRSCRFRRRRCTGWVGSARPSWPWSTPTATPPTTT
jgi:hypothetical protein